jgi:23S rRNA (cytidine1920-2'-O)/16S rRNA (cytidine1409-2'-O)-methyltransferase
VTQNRPRRIRLDALLAARGLAPSRDWAQRLIRAGEVRVAGQVVDQPAHLLLDDPALLVTVDAPPRFVSRGGFKLEGALDAFAIDPAGCTCADVGSSTGGFTDCLLQRGAARVYALDVGANQLHWKLRSDSRVVVHERVNVRYLETMPEPIDLAVVDVSFISLELILPRVIGWMHPASRGIVALVKPQFEAGREHVGKGGIVRDPAVHDAVLARIHRITRAIGWPVHACIDSPILGTDGNKEFLVWLRQGDPKEAEAPIQK